MEAYSRKTLQKFTAEETRLTNHRDGHSMSPKQHRGEVTSDLLLEAALRVFVESGEQGLTVNAVIRTSGVSLGSLYHHFGSLDGLIGALSHRWLDRLLGELTKALRNAGTARAGIAGAVEAYLTFIQEHRGPALLLHSPSPTARGWHGAGNSGTPRRQGSPKWLSGSGRAWIPGNWPRSPCR